ncbi:MAG: DUF5615 family PIN-like protein [Planctomycetes bacterium]|nr:DUF5615 family PIN-like protein [Planctomycetota bacterium]
MLRFLADQNFNENIVRGLVRRIPLLEIVLARDAGLATTEDPDLLDWAAGMRRIVLSHDIQTLPGYAIERVQAGKRMPGLFMVPQTAPIGPSIEDIQLLAECSREDEWEGQILYLPFPRTTGDAVR